MRERSEETYWNCEDRIRTHEESIVREKHQYAGSTENTDLLYLVNSAIRMSTWTLNLEAAEHGFLIRMLRIPWTDKSAHVRCSVELVWGKGACRT